MLNPILPASALVVMLAAPAQAQLNTVYTFGTCPYTPLVPSKTTLFAALGANGGNNPIFAYDTKTGVGNTIYTLPGEGRLVAAANGILYGWVSGGTSSTLFSLNPANSAYQSLHVFPKGAPTTLTYHAGVLYGTDDNGGPTGNGTVFGYDLATGKFRTLYNFTGTSTDGNAPAVAPLYHGGYLYVVSSTALLKLRAKNGKVVWDTPFTYAQGGFGVLLALRDGTLYGVNQSYGANDAGTIYSADPATGVVSLVYSFSSVTGAYSSLFAGETLYGTYGSNSQNADGGIFSYSIESGTFSQPYSFSASTEPDGDAVALGRVAYGVAATQSGDNGTCSLYSFPL